MTINGDLPEHRQQTVIKIVLARNGARGATADPTAQPD